MALAVYNKLFSDLFGDLVDLFYPRPCAGCARPLIRQEPFLCLYCRYSMPLTGYWKMASNPVERIFWGRVKIHRAHSYLYFRKSGMVQKLLHQIKYRNNLAAAEGLGEMYGRQLNAVFDTKRPEIILPVPLHLSRLKTRGYNQSERIASGYSKATSIPVMPDLLIREKKTISQTKKERWTRIRDMEGVFRVPDPTALSNKHVLIMDDVITTGSTAEACIHALTEVPGITISFASLACA